MPAREHSGRLCAESAAGARPHLPRGLERQTNRARASMVRAPKKYG